MAYTAQQKSLVSARMREIAKAKQILEEPVVNTPQELPIEKPVDLPIEKPVDLPVEPELPVVETEKKSEVVPDINTIEVPVEKEPSIPTEPEKKSFPKKKVKKEDSNES